jgi:hypothetical protein
METIQYDAFPHDDYTDGLIYDGHDIQINRIEEYGNDEYNFYPDAAF